MSRKIGLGLCTLVFLLTAGTLAFAASRIEKDLKLEPGGRLVVDAGASDVFVTGRSASGAHVVVTSNRDDLQELFTLNFSEEPGAVRIEMHKHSLQLWPKHLEVRMEVEVPTKTNLDIRTGGGDVKVNHLEGETDLETSGGDVKATELKGNLNARTSGGDMELRDLTGDVSVKTSGGDITLANVHGRVEAHTSGGDVTASLARGNAKGGEIETSGGDIELRLDPAINLSLDASTSSGEVTSNLPHLSVTGEISSSRLHGTLGSGGETLRVHTNGGSVRISAL
jgi:DUF4097 and DUF4098 domain-containing protein YvlB